MKVEVGDIKIIRCQSCRKHRQFKVTKEYHTFKPKPEMFRQFRVECMDCKIQEIAVTNSLRADELTIMVF